MNLGFSDLKYFITTADCKSISKAAEELGIRQPSLSLAIKKIEESLEVTLFFRGRSGVMLTREGNELYREASEILSSWEQATSIVKGVKFDLTGKIRFGCHPSVGLFTLPKFLPKFVKENPKVRFNISHGLSRDLTDMVINNQIDMAIVVNPIDNPDLVKIKLYQDEVCLWTKKVSEGLPLICDLNLLQSKSLIKKLQKLDINTNEIISIGSLENIVSLVEKGTGVGIIPSRVVAESGKKLKRVDGAPLYKDEHFLIYRYENRHIKLFSQLRESITKNLKIT